MNRKLESIYPGNNEQIDKTLITRHNRERLKPFVLFDAGHFEMNNRWGLDWHPHSGVATITFPYFSDLHHGDSGNNFGVIKEGGVQWMASGSGIWHKEEYEPKEGMIGIQQLWVLLPETEEMKPVNYLNIQPEEIPQIGNTRIFFGEYEGVKGRKDAPVEFTYLDVSLKAGEEWTFNNTELTRAFLYARIGSLEVEGELLGNRRIGILEDSNKTIRVKANEETKFTLAAAKPNEQKIVHEYGQMHTSRENLIQAKENILKIGKEFLNR